MLELHAVPPPFYCRCRITVLLLTALLPYAGVGSFISVPNQGPLSLPCLTPITDIHVPYAPLRTGIRAQLHCKAVAMGAVAVVTFLGQMSQTQPFLALACQMHTLTP